VRHHLRLLCADGRAVALGAARKPGRGRPVKLFGPAASLSGDTLKQLTDVALTVKLQKLSGAKRAAAVRALARGMTVPFGQVEQNGPLGKRLAHAVEKLNTLNYQSRWEAGPEGPRILFAHCPYAAIISNHPELCAMDAVILEEMTGQAMHQTSRIGIRSSAICVFQSR
jgi:predicted ArsR family transcriptional regulator